MGLLCSSPFVSPLLHLVLFHVPVYLSSPFLLVLLLHSRHRSSVCLFAIAGSVRSGKKEGFFKGGVQEGTCRTRSSFRPWHRTMDRERRMTPGATGALVAARIDGV